jgi:glycosyltransferase involved in cell wall biosynthesis
MRPVTVAVVVPVFNCASTIEQTLASVANQTVKPAELIVIDDGSIDGTSRFVEDFCSRCRDFPVKLIIQPNKGPGAARNAGVQRATSDYIAFLDGDDIWYPPKLERMVAAIRERPAADILCHDEFRRLPDGKIERRVQSGPAVPDMYEHLLFKRNCVLTSAVVLRKACFLAVGGFSEDRALESNEDWDLWLRLARANYRFLFFPEVLGEWIDTGRSITSNVEHHFHTELNVLKYHFNLSGVIQSNPSKCQWRLAMASYGKGRGYYRAQAYRKALTAYGECLRQYPFFLRAYAGLLILACRLPV